MRDFKYYILLFAGVLFMQSCLHEEEDIFGKSAAERLNEAQKLYENILTKPSNGWVLEYIAGDTDVTRRGAFNFLLKFENGTVTAAVDQNALDDIDPSMNTHKKITSLYKLEQDMSITLSFDTYNLFLHYYHEQHGSYTTYKGDFEFTIMEAYDDLIILRGKKYGNIMEMHRLPDNVTWDDYLDQINNIYNQVSEYPEFSIHQSNNQLSSGSILETRQFSFSYEGKSYLKNIVYTPTGMKLIQPLTINGKEAQNFIWNSTNSSFTCTDNGATDIVIQMTIPAGHVKYSEYLGTYLFKYKDTAGTEYSRTVNIIQKVRGKSYIVENFAYNVSDAVVVMQYDKSRGMLCIGAHTIKPVGIDDNYNLYPMVDTGNFYASLGEAYGRFMGKLTSSNLIQLSRDPEGSLSTTTVGFRVIRRVISNGVTSNYDTGIQNRYMVMSFQKQ